VDSEVVKTGCNLRESSKEGCGLKRAALRIMMNTSGTMLNNPRNDLYIHPPYAFMA
jgi:hypothetical protein